MEWYDDITRNKRKRIACKVWDKLGDKIKLAYIVEYDPDGGHFQFEDESGEFWRYAEPLTKDDIL